MLGQEICSSKALVVVMHREDFVERRFVRIDVDHPTEDRGPEAAARGIAGVCAISDMASFSLACSSASGICILLWSMPCMESCWED